MEQKQEGLIVGFDCHTDVHVAAALNPMGQLQATRTFPASPEGYAMTAKWLDKLGPVLAVGVESTGSYGAALTRALTRSGIRVIEVNRPHRHLRARRGKSDAIDAEAAARKVLSGETTGAAKDSAGLVEVIRQLSVARDGAVKARTAALSQFSGLLITAPARLRQRFSTPKTLAGRAARCARSRITDATPLNPEGAAKLALRSVARRIESLSSEVRTLDEHLQAVVGPAAPRTTQQLGLGTHTTAALLVAAGENIHRFSSEAAFAHLCGVAPVSASSGKTRRHRLNWGGNRRANQALHMVAVVRLRYCRRSRTYLERRMQEGKSKKEIIRCLKRYIARDLFRTLRADLATLPSRT